MECCILLCLLSPLLGQLLPRSGKCLILRLELCRTPWMGKLPPPWYYSTAIIPKDRDYRMKSWLASMLAGEFSLGSAMTDTRALQEKCKIMSCRYLIASTYLRRVAMFQFGLHTRFPSTPGPATASRALGLKFMSDLDTVTTIVRQYYC